MNKRIDENVDDAWVENLSVSELKNILRFLKAFADADPTKKELFLMIEQLEVVLKRQGKN